jgi:DNA polymerase-3 subunit gamma/tau
VRELWPQIVEAVKHRRLTWMLLLNNARVVGFYGETLQIGFDNPGARNSFANGDSEEVLKQAIGTVAGAQWRIETLVDPGGDGGPRGGGGRAPRPPAPGGGPGMSAPGPSGQAGPSAGPSGPGGGSPYGSAQTAPSPQRDTPGAPGPAARASGGPAAPASAPGGPGGSGGRAGAAAARGNGSAAAGAPYGDPYASGVTEPPPIEDDVPEDDDPDLVDSALSGHDLFIKSLGATVIEEIPHD